MPMTLGWRVASTRRSGVRCPSSFASCGWTPTEHQMLAWRSAMARTPSNWSSRVPMVSMPADAGAAGARQHARLVAGEARESRDGSGCRSASAAPPLRRPRRSAGRRPAAPAAPCPAPARGRRRRTPAPPAGTASWSRILPAASGMKGCTSRVTRRIVSASTYSTVSRRAGSVLASAHGACAST